eukprot:8879748-Karenia_brevis.AAC.1
MASAGAVVRSLLILESPTWPREAQGGKRGPGGPREGPGSPREALGVPGNAHGGSTPSNDDHFAKNFALRGAKSAIPVSQIRLPGILRNS